MAKQIELPLEEALAKLAEFRKEIQGLSRDFLNAADEALKASKNFNAPFNNTKFDEATRKNADANEKMRESTEKLQKATEGYHKEQENIIKITATTRREWTNVIGSLDANIVAHERLKKELKEAQDEIKKSTGSKTKWIKKEFELKQAISDNNIVIKQQIKETQAAEDSSSRYSITLGLMKKAYRDLSQAEKETDFGVNLKNEIDELDHQMKKADASIGNFHRNVGNYSGGIVGSFSDMKSAFKELFSGNITGAFESFSSGFNQIKESISSKPLKGLTENVDELNISTENTAKGGLSSFANGLKNITSSAVRFLATPIGAFIGAITVSILAGIVAIGAYIKGVWDYNQAIKETLSLTKQLSGEVGKSADLIRQKVQAISDTFNTDFNETIQAAKKLSTNFNIPFNKALDEIELGLIKGGRYNKEYLDSINEYPVFFNKAGYSVREFIDMINESFDQGVYSDKFIDGIKEADLSLKEQTKSTRDALVNAYGASFTDDILQRIRIGATSTKDALDELALKAKEVNLNQQQYAQLTADLYKSAGEDVGGAAKMFDIYRSSIDNANRPLTETEQRLQNLTVANQDLEKAMDNALKSDKIVTLQQNFELFWIQTKTIFFELLSFVKDGFKWLDKMTGASNLLSVAWGYMQLVSKSFSDVIKTFKELAAVIGINSENSIALKIVLYGLLIPVKMLVEFLQKVANTLRVVSIVTQEVTNFISALRMTISDLSNDIRNLDFSSLASIGSIMSDNIDKVRKLKREMALSNTIKDANDALLEVAKAGQDAAEKALDIEKKRKEDQARIDKENAEKAAKEAEKLAKKKEELARKHAAEEKKRQEEAKRLAEQAYQEDLALMQANLESYKLHNLSKLESGKAFSKAAMDLEVERLEEILAQQEQIAIKESKLDYDKLQRKVANGQALTSEEQKLLTKIYELNFNHSKALIELQKSYDELGLKQKEDILKLDLLYKIANGEKKEKAERWYNDAVYELRKQNYKKITGLYEEEVLTKYYTGQKLSESEIQYVEFILDKRKELKDRIKEDSNEELSITEEKAYKQKDFDLKNNRDRIETEKEYLTNIFDAKKANLAAIYGLDYETVLNKEKSNEVLTEAEKEFLRKNKDLHIDYERGLQDLQWQKAEEHINMLGESFGAETEIREVFNAFRKVLYLKDSENQKEAELAKLDLAAKVANAAAQIAGEQTAFGKAMAATSIAINTTMAIIKAYADFPFPVATGFAVAIGTISAIQIAKLLAAKPPEPPKFQAPQFAKGITNSGYEGAAIVDEIGPEIHLDKKGNIKSFGENKGARMTQIMKGDTIIPNKYTERIKAMLGTTSKPDVTSINTMLLGFPIGNSSSKNEYDFQRLEKKLDKLIKVNSTKKDKSYLMDNDKIIEVTTKSNGTHQRYIDKIDSEPKNRPTRLN